MYIKMVLNELKTVRIENDYTWNTVQSVGT